MASCKMTLRLTADDVGAIPSIDTAVRDLVEINIINSLAVFANGLCDKSWVLHSNRAITVGLHLTYSYGTPMSALDSSSGLVDCSGNFLMPHKPEKPTTETIKHSISNYLSSFAAVQAVFLKKEAIAQYAAFVETFGKAPDFVNVHHDLDNCENLSLVLADLFPNLPTRAMLNKGNYFYLYDFLDENELFQVSEQRIKHLLYSGIEKQFVENMDGEVVFHPALYTDELQTFSTYSKMREREYCILSSDWVKIMLHGKESDAIERNIFSG